VNYSTVLHFSGVMSGFHISLVGKLRLEDVTTVTVQNR
jgi:hypothetical protein